MLLLILLRVILSVSSNAAQKRLLLNRAGIYHTWILTYLFMLGPAVLFALINSGPAGPNFWQAIAIGGGLDAIGNLAMVAALRTTDVSVFGPLNAFRPILALLFGWIFLREAPTGWGLAGLGITVTGGLILFTGPSTHSKTTSKEIWRALFLRFSGLALGVVGAVFLKRAATITSAEVTVAGWIACGLVVLFASAVIHRRVNVSALSESLRVHLPWLLLHATFFIAMQWLTIRIFQSTLLAYSFVYFQLGIVLQVFVGRIMFKEPAFARRLVASLIMAAGSILILWKG